MDDSSRTVQKASTHLWSLIMVHVGVGQRAGRAPTERTRAPDIDSPALLPTTSTRNVPAGRWKKDLGTEGELT